MKTYIGDLTMTNQLSKGTSFNVVYCVEYFLRSCCLPKFHSPVKSPVLELIIRTQREQSLPALAPVSLSIIEDGGIAGWENVPTF